jgi:hypothetical protein
LLKERQESYSLPNVSVRNRFFSDLLGWLAMIAVRGNNYHAQVLRSVTAELGSMATPYLEARPFVEQIKAAFRRGDPPRSAALALILIIREAESEKNSS